MKTVTKAEFYRRIFDGNLDVHPHPERDKTVWLFRDRRIFGVSRPGYLCEGAESYEVAP